MPERRVRAALVAMALACGEGQDATPRPPLVPPAQDLPHAAPDVPLDDLLAAGADPARLPDVLRRVGTPRQLERVRIAGGEQQGWRYPGLSFHVVAMNGAERLTRVEVTGEGYRTADGLRVGMTREAVTGIRGQPSRTEAGAELYPLEVPEGAVLWVVYSEEGVVEALVWHFPRA